MKYTVVYRPTAERRLAEFWLNADDPAAITAAANALDVALAANPLAVGESREGQTRMAIHGPLALLFDVYEQDRKVVVWEVWRPAT